jgi:hypothetical protein
MPAYRDQALIDTLSPDYLGADRFTLAVNAACQQVRAGRIVLLDVDYRDNNTPHERPTVTSDEARRRQSLPLDLIIQPCFGDGGAQNGYYAKAYTRAAPAQVVWRPTLAGVYLIVLRERYHNRWQGRLTVTVGGDTTDVTPWKRKT